MFLNFGGPGKQEATFDFSKKASARAVRNSSTPSWEGELPWASMGLSWLLSCWKF